MNEQNPMIEAAVLREAEQGLRETVKIFKTLGMKPLQIAFMFRTMADELEAPQAIIVPDSKETH